MLDSLSGSDLLNELAHEFAERYRRGERPPLQEYADRYPELAEETRELFPTFAMIEHHGSGVGRRLVGREPTRRCLRHSGTTGSCERLGEAAWVSSTKRCKRVSADMSP